MPMNTDKLYSYLTRLLSFGLIFFCTSIYYFPDSGDSTRVFYIAILIPTIFLIFEIVKKINLFDWRLILFLLFPLYLSISYFWAPESNVTKSFFYHFRSFFCVLIFTLSSLYIFRIDREFLAKFIRYLFIFGSLSAFVTLFYNVYHHGVGSFYQLQEPFTDNPNKAGSIYLIAFIVCLFFSFYQGSGLQSSYAVCFYFLVLCCFTSGCLSVACTCPHTDYWRFVFRLFCCGGGST